MKSIAELEEELEACKKDLEDALRDKQRYYELSQDALKRDDNYDYEEYTIRMNRAHVRINDLEWKAYTIKKAIDKAKESEAESRQGADRG